MKLIYCPECKDIVALRPEKRTCVCGKSWGQYVDYLNATIGGLAIPLGFTNESFFAALFEDHQKSGSAEFLAFVIFLPCKTITREEEKT